MKILLVHNRYRIRGGEDAVFDAEKALLEETEHVVAFVEDNRRMLPVFGPLAAAWRLKWSRPAWRRISDLLRRERPDVAHFHNIFPLITPSAYDACRDAGVPVVQTLHNFRIWCAPGTFLREGKICEDCVAGGPAAGVAHRCYRGSALASRAVARMQEHHHRAGTWKEKVDLFLCLTETARRKAVELGLPESKLLVKPNFAPRPPAMRTAPGARALFVGRLSEEKGAGLAVDAFLGLPGAALDVVGSGPSLVNLRRRAAGSPSIAFTGPLPSAEVYPRLSSASFLVFPSIGPEMFGRAVVEAMACGLPVLASRIGGLPDIVRDGETGLLFRPGDVDDLRAKARRLFDDPGLNAKLGARARAAWEELYSPEKNRPMLLDAYRRAIAGSARRDPR